ncbi:MAG: ABC transporter ATP-binding protein [Chlamydiota bacterium]
MSKPLLEIVDLSISFSDQEAPVQKISFTLHEEETLGIVGESGSGKTLSMCAILGLLPPNAKVTGSIFLEGKDILHIPEREKRSFRGKKIGMVFQDPMTSLNPTMKIGYQIVETITLHNKISYKAAKKKALDLLDSVFIPYPEKSFHSYPHELSGGMRQRVCIAIALSASPSILIADEPTTALDVTIQAEILSLFKMIQERHKLSILIISHNLGVITSLSDRILVMYGGKIVETGLAQEILQDPQHPYTKLLLNSYPRLDKKPLQELPTIFGNPPIIQGAKEICSFTERCPYKEEICTSTALPTFFHRANCWRCHASKSST